MTAAPPTDALPATATPPTTGREPEPGGRPVAVLAHGSGSSADFVRRAFGRPLSAAGWRLVAVTERSGDVQRVARALGAAAARHRADVVGGVSLGAHAALLLAARPERYGAAAPRGVLAVMPAWLGRPDATARLSAAAADAVAARGLARELRRLASEGHDWVADELLRAWRGRREADLVAELRRTAASAAPTPAQLRQVAAPVGLVALRDDPFHPAVVAGDLLRLLPRAGLVVLPAAAPAGRRDTLGAAAVRALGRAAAA